MPEIRANKKFYEYPDLTGTLCSSRFREMVYRDFLVLLGDPTGCASFRW